MTSDSINANPALRIATPAFSLDDLRLALRQVQARRVPAKSVLIDAQRRFMGVSVMLSRHCTRVCPARVHKRHARRKAYHKRVQKKWIKRFGLIDKPCMYVAHFQGVPVIFAHPDLYMQETMKAADHYRGHTPTGFIIDDVIEG